MSTIVNVVNASCTHAPVCLVHIVIDRIYDLFNSRSILCLQNTWDFLLSKGFLLNVCLCRKHLSFAEDRNHERKRENAVNK